MLDPPSTHTHTGVRIKDFRGAQTWHIKIGLEGMVYRDIEASSAFVECAVEEWYLLNRALLLKWDLEYVSLTV